MRDAASLFSFTSFNGSSRVWREFWTNQIDNNLNLHIFGNFKDKAAFSIHSDFFFLNVQYIAVVP